MSDDFFLSFKKITAQQGKGKDYEFPYLGNCPTTLQTYSLLISHFCIINSNSRAFFTESAIIISPEVSRSNRLTAGRLKKKECAIERKLESWFKS